MDLRVRAAYLAGLLEGLKLDTQDGEGKLLKEIVSIIADVSSTMEILALKQRTIVREINELQKYIELMTGNLVITEEDDAESKEEIDGSVEIKIICPACGKEIWFGSEVLNGDDIICNFCGEEIEVDFDDKFNN